MRKINDLRKKFIRFAGMSVMVLACVAMLSLTAYAAEGKVTASAAKIRKDASTSSEALGTATKDQKFTINGEKTGADGKIWYEVALEGNKTGYIRSDLMEKTGDTAPEVTIAPTVPVEDVQPVSAKIVGNTVRVRSDASTQGSIIANVLKDTVVTVNGRAQDSQNKTWYRVSYSSDAGEVTGFIRYDFLDISGEVKPIEKEPVVTPPANDPQTNPEDTTTTTTPPTVNGKYYVIEKDGEWFLVDSDAEFKYNAESLINAALENPKLIESKDKKIKSQSAWILILVILVLALAAVAGFLFYKMREVMNDAYFAAVEKETLRQRQGQKANNPTNVNRNKNVMHTVGTGAPKSGTQARPAGAGANRPAGAKPAGAGQQRPAGSAPQTVKVSNPADTRAPKAPVQQKTVNGQKPVSGQQRPANPQGRPVNGQPKPANQAQPKPATPVQEKPVVPTPKTVAQKPAQETNKQTWQSKNFAADDDDEFEFEFLNWDGSEEE